MRQTLARKYLLTLVLIAFFCFTASASTLGPFPTSTPIPATFTDWNSSLAFPMFNPALGTLLSVEITTSVGLDTIVTVTNSSTTSPSSGHVKTEVVVTLSDPLADLSQFTDTSFPVGAGLAFNLGPSSAVTSPLLTATGSSDVTYDALSANGNAILGEFTGTGTILLPVSTFTQTLLATSAGNTASSQVTHASATGNITFTFSPAAITPGPEPGTMTMIGAALLALGLFARKRLPH